MDAGWTQCVHDAKLNKSIKKKLKHANPRCAFSQKTISSEQYGWKKNQNHNLWKCERLTVKAGPAEIF